MCCVCMRACVRGRYYQSVQMGLPLVRPQQMRTRVCFVRNRFTGNNVVSRTELNASTAIYPWGELKCFEFYIFVVPHIL
jgi:hypothetical protein